MFVVQCQPPPLSHTPHSHPAGGIHCTAGCIPQNPSRDCRYTRRPYLRTPLGFGLDLLQSPVPLALHNSHLSQLGKLWSPADKSNLQPKSNCSRDYLSYCWSPTLYFGREPLCAAADYLTTTVVIFQSRRWVQNHCWLPCDRSTRSTTAVLTTTGSKTPSSTMPQTTMPIVASPGL
ncbi:hypothetical protein BJY04DRAFT_4497 [Aspergillus karnatakaensis]|uniref:uncharacterized protein n=1 Tax=Aspergillus karnatakaensis TaxID=1810916 RepID=UPI003CCE189A